MCTYERDDRSIDMYHVCDRKLAIKKGEEWRRCEEGRGVKAGGLRLTCSL
jgi:hypothetical protein